ncbi:MAG: DegQ family serine endoprotease [Deltaproteobacteria bacterium]|nr:DegQ family serine endoprotease [Deltaproteobacteria bacterium]
MNKKVPLWLTILLVIFPLAIGAVWLTGMKSTQNRLTAPSHDPIPSKSDFPSLSSIVSKVAPAVVNISTVRVVRGPGPVFKYFFGPFEEGDPFKEFFERFFGDIPQREFRQKSLGSGFIISKDGYILTNNHVVEKATEIRVRLLNKEQFEAKVIGRDPKTDIALIKIKANHSLSAATLGDSDALRVGDWVIAIGNPFGLGHTVTVGIISAKERIIGAGPYDNFLQTDAAINPGNSGGPLVNLEGEVVGINTAIVAQAQGIGFAIPINMAKYILSQLKERGKVMRGWLGVMIQEVTPEIAHALGLKEVKGALVADVTPGSPADKADIRRGDVIIEYNGKKIEEMNELPRLVANTPVGKSVPIKIWRNGKIKQLTVKVGELEEKVAKGERRYAPQDLGLKVEELTPYLAQRLGVKRIHGVVITYVVQGSPAHEAGLSRGDIILKINRHPIEDLNDYQDIINSAKPGDTLLFLIERREGTLFVALKVPKD